MAEETKCYRLCPNRGKARRRLLHGEWVEYRAALPLLPLAERSHHSRPPSPIWKEKGQCLNFVFPSYCSCCSVAALLRRRSIMGCLDGHHPVPLSACAWHRARRAPSDASPPCATPLAARVRAEVCTAPHAAPRERHRGSPVRTDGASEGRARVLRRTLALHGQNSYAKTQISKNGAGSPAYAICPK